MCIIWPCFFFFFSCDISYNWNVSRNLAGISYYCRLWENAGIRTYIYGLPFERCTKSIQEEIRLVSLGSISHMKEGKKGMYYTKMYCSSNKCGYGSSFSVLFLSSVSHNLRKQLEESAFEVQKWATFKRCNYWLVGRMCAYTQSRGNW